MYKPNSINVSDCLPQKYIKEMSWNNHICLEKLESGEWDETRAATKDSNNCEFLNPHDVISFVLSAHTTPVFKQNLCKVLLPQKYTALCRVC